MRPALLLAALIAGLGLAANSRAAEERFLVVRNGESVGSLTARRIAGRIHVDYQVVDNGRGPEVHEHLDLDAAQLPRNWLISGHAESGAPVSETFRWRGATAVWQTVNDRGSAAAASPHVYLPNDASPYQFGVLLRAALGAPQHTIAAWPQGTVHAERVRDVALGAGTARHTATVWALWGLSLGHVFVLAGADGQFLAWLDAHHLTIPAGWLGEAAELQALATSLDVEMLRALSPQWRHHWDVPVYLRNVRVLDPDTGQRSMPTTVATFRGRITAIRGDNIPDPTGVVIDGEGGTLVPSLFDMHVHLTPWAGPLQIAAGVTTTRDMGNNNVELLSLVAEFDAARILGPRVLRSGYMDARSPYSAHDGFVVSNLAEGLDDLRWYADRGYVQLKFASGMNPAWVAPLAAEAHRLGMRVAGHVPSFMSVEQAVRDGYDEVTHVNQLLLSFLIDTDREDTRTPFRFTALGERGGRLDLGGAPFTALLQLMRDRRVAFDPTLGSFYGMLRSRPGIAPVPDEPWLDHAPGPVQRARKTQQLDMRPEQDDAYRASAEMLLRAVQAAHVAGIQLVPGTDDIAGLSLGSELETWQRAGVPAADVLRLATIGCARYLHLDAELGTIERGKRADLLLIPGDPTSDVAALRKVRLVMKDGDVIFPDEIYAAMQIGPFATRPAVTAPLQH